MIELEKVRAALPMPELMARLGLGESAKPKAHCPFHQDERPSFSVFPEKGRWYWNCFAGCGNGDEIDLLVKHLGLTTGDAIRRYAELAGISNNNNLSAAPVLAEPRQQPGLTESETQDGKPGEARESTKTIRQDTADSRGGTQTISEKGGDAKCAAHAEESTDTKTSTIHGVNSSRKQLSPRPSDRSGNVQAGAGATAQLLRGADIDKLAKWRGYSREFTNALAVNHVVKLYDGHIAFPVKNGWHYRIKEDGSWRYSEGAKPELFAPGKIEEGAHIHCFESPWDALAFADSQDEWDNIVATRGAGNVKLIAERFKGHTGTLYLWPQTDEPGEVWAQKIRLLLPDAQIKLADIPAKFKDLNEWTRAGATSGDVFNALVDAKDFARVETGVTRPSEPRPDSASPLNDPGIPLLGASLELANARGADNGLAKILDDIATFLTRYVSFPLPEQAIAIALWVAHCHVYTAFQFSPYLHIHSPEKRCGKTRLLECLKLLVPRPRAFVRPSEPVLFRTIEREKPTLLLDEIDTIFTREAEDSNEGLRAVLNAGFQAGAKIPRCVGQGFDLAEFSVFCPKAIAGIGKIPDTVRDRCIEIRLVRQTSDKKATRFRFAEADVAAIPMRRALEEWSKTSIPTLSSARPHIPEQLGDRAADMFEPLLAIAESAGREWADKGSDAIIALAAESEDQSVGVQLLGFCRNIFGVKNADSLATTELLEALIGVESADAPWVGWWEADYKRDNKHRPANGLARLLGPYGITPGTITARDGESANGYRRAQFLDAWKRYLGEPAAEATEMELGLT